VLIPRARFLTATEWILHFRSHPTAGTRRPNERPLSACRVPTLMAGTHPPKAKPVRCAQLRFTLSPPNPSVRRSPHSIGMYLCILIALSPIRAFALA